MIWRDDNLRTLVILGAGATRGAEFVTKNPDELKPPVDTDFFKQLRIGAEECASLQEARKALYDSLDSADLAEPEDDTSMEDYFVRAEFVRTLRIEMAATHQLHKDLRNRYAQPVRHLRTAVGNLIAHTTAENCSHHQRLAELLKVKDVVASFNYDTVIDRALRHRSADAGHQPDYGFVPGCPIPTRDTYTDFFCDPQNGHSVFLLKLHGSLDWRRAPSHDAQSGETVAQRDPGLGDDDFASAFIVPPLWSKPIADSPVLTHIWTIARVAMRQCEVLILIGYSLPKTDQLARTLFEVDSNLESSETLKKLVVVNPDDDAYEQAVEILARSRKGVRDPVHHRSWEQMIEAEGC